VSCSATTATPGRPGRGRYRRFRSWSALGAVVARRPQLRRARRSRRQPETRFQDRSSSRCAQMTADRLSGAGLTLARSGSVSDPDMPFRPARGDRRERNGLTKARDRRSIDPC
jgi:hypothetical protein